MIISWLNHKTRMKIFFSFFAQHRLLAIMLTSFVIVLGLGRLTNIQRDIFPNANFDELLISTAYPGASPEDVELKVTNNIEKQLHSIAGIERYTSWSKENFSQIHIALDPNEKDIEKVVTQIREAVNRVSDLPPEVQDRPLVTELNTSMFPIIEVGLTGNLPYKELRSQAKLLQKKMENIKGISEVSAYGYRAREVRVEIEPDALIKHQISLSHIVAAIGSRNIRASGGNFESYTNEKNIVTLAQFRDPNDVGDVVVRSSFDGPLIKVKDLAEIKNDFTEESVISRVNGHIAISLVARKTANADIMRTTDRIKQLVEEEQKKLPAGIKLLLSNDRSKYVRNRLDIVLTNGVLGLILVLFVLSLFISRRLAIWVALGIPVAILGTIFVLPFFDQFLDSVSLTALILIIGIIVDDAIIISEHIYQRYEQGDPPVTAAINGVVGVFKPVITTILTTIVAFFPLVFMPGILGKFVYIIPLVVIIALFVSLIESTIALPAHLCRSLQKQKSRPNPPLLSSFMEKFRTSYLSFIQKALRRRYTIIVIASVLLISTITYAVQFLEFVMFPSSTADRFLMVVETPVGSSLQSTSEKIKQLEQLISQLPKEELDSYVSRIGRVGTIGNNQSENLAGINVFLTPFAQRNRTADEIVEELRAKTKSMDGFKRINFRIDTGGPPVGRAILVRIIGSDDEVREVLADKVEAFLRNVKGAKDIERNDNQGKQQLEIKLDYPRLARLGMTVAEVARQVRIAYDGEVVTSVRYDDEDVDFRVIFNKAARQKQNLLDTLVLQNQGGLLTPLRKVARLDTSQGPENVYHYRGERAIVIVGDINQKENNAVSVAQQVRKEFADLSNYAGMQIFIGGEAEKSEESLNHLTFIYIIATIAIYCLLILLFNSWIQPILVIVALPFGLIGVIFAFTIHQQPLGFLAMTGIVGLVGVVVNDSLVLVNHINELRKSKIDIPIFDLVATGATDRLRAVVLTTISTVAGLLPLAYGIGGSDPYMSPMALALGYGLLFATPLTLLLVPCLYLFVEDCKNFKNRLRPQSISPHT